MEKRLYQLINRQPVPIPLSGDGAPRAASLQARACIPCHNVTFAGSDGRRPIFWRETEPDERYVICDGGDDGFGGTLPQYLDRMIMGAGPNHPAGESGGSSDVRLEGLKVGETSLNSGQDPSHRHMALASSSSSTSQYLGPPESTYQYASTLASLSVTGAPEKLAYAWVGLSSPAPTQGVFSTAGRSEPHTHALSADTAQAEVLPPFYSLAIVCFIGN